MATSTIPFNIGELKYMGTINSSNDVNSLADGIYHISSGVPTNAPSGTTYSVLFQITISSGMIHQYIFHPWQAKLYMREYSGTPSWLAWRVFTGTIM